MAAINDAKITIKVDTTEALRQIDNLSDTLKKQSPSQQIGAKGEREPHHFDFYDGKTGKLREGYVDREGKWRESRTGYTAGQVNARDDKQARQGQRRRRMKLDTLVTGLILAGGAAAAASGHLKGLVRDLPMPDTAKKAIEEKVQATENAITGVIAESTAGITAGMKTVKDMAGITQAQFFAGGTPSLPDTIDFGKNLFLIHQKQAALETKLKFIGFDVVGKGVYDMFKEWTKGSVSQ